MNAIPIITAVCAVQGTATDSRNDAMYLSREDSKLPSADSAAVVQPSPDIKGSRQSAESPMCDRIFPALFSRRSSIPDLSRNSRQNANAVTRGVSIHIKYLTVIEIIP